jgi:4-amino-4-deoxy-L-arabinose transferase-like glycosyltransferase
MASVITALIKEEMKNKEIPDKIIYLAIAIIAGLLFIPFLGGVHLFDWDEVNFAESAREMIVTGNYSTVQINFLPFWEKPPLFIWMQVLSMKLFGINEFAARFPNAVCGIVTLLVLYSVGRKLYDQRFALLWVMTYAGSLLPFLYFKSGIIDPWFNLFIFLGVYFIYQYFTRASSQLPAISLSGFFIGLAILTKGPVAVLILFLTILVYCILKKFRVKVTLTGIIVFSIAMIITGGFWFLLQIMKGNFSIVADFIEYQVRLFKTRDAGHGGFLFYHFAVLFFGVFPASVIAIPALFGKSQGNTRQVSFSIMMKILFWTVLLLFTIVKTKIVHYSSLCYLPLTYLAAILLYQLYQGKQTVKMGLIWITGLVGFLFVLTGAALPFFDRFKSTVLDHIKIADPFALACINADAGWKGFEGLPAVILLTGIVLLFSGAYKAKIFWGFRSLFICTGLFVYLTIIFITPRIEKYSQYAAIEFFKSVNHEDAYLETLGYKSYAHLFYGQKKPSANPERVSREWLLTGDTDKKVYFTIKVDKRDRFLNQYPDIHVIYEKNGFVFCVREIP